MKYDGYNGDIDATESHVTILRDGMIARAAFGKNATPRVIPLTCISGVRLQPASRLKNGHVQVLLAGVDAPALSTTTAASNADTVTFTHKHNDAFATLAAWLEQVAQHNAAHGLSEPPAELLEGGGQQGRFDKLAAKMEGAAASSREKVDAAREKADALAAATAARKEAGRASQGAAAQATTPDNGFIDWDRFEHVTWDGATLGLEYDEDQPDQLDLALQEVKLAKKELAAEKRHLVLAISEIRAGHRDKQANRLPAIRGGGTTGKFVRAAQAASKANDRANTQNQVAPIEDEKFRLERMVTALDEMALYLQKAGAGTTSRGATVAAAPLDIADQLGKLAALRDQGILTDDEFAAQKAKLLG